MNSMCASVAAFYEGGRTIRVAETQVSPLGQEDVRLKVAFCGICGTDLHTYHGHMDQRVRLPQIIGHEMSGVIEAVGDRVTEWKVGEHVTVRPILHCGECFACRAGYTHICTRIKVLGIDAPGAMQGLWNVPAHTLHRLPASLTLQQGALVEPISVACHDVRRGEVKPGDNVMVLGSGPIGLLIALIAKLAGARVLVSEVNPFRLDLAKSFGIDTVNPRERDLVRVVADSTDGAGADVVFEVSGVAGAVESMTKLVRPRGRLVMVAIHPNPVPVDLFQFFLRELSLQGARLYERRDFDQAIEIASSGQLPLDRIVSLVTQLDGLQNGLEKMDSGASIMKILIACS